MCNIQYNHFLYVFIIISLRFTNYSCLAQGGILGDYSSVPTEYMINQSLYQYKIFKIFIKNYTSTYHISPILIVCFFFDGHQLGSTIIWITCHPELHKICSYFLDLLLSWYVTISRSVLVGLILRAYLRLWNYTIFNCNLTFNRFFPYFAANEKYVIRLTPIRVNVLFTCLAWLKAI